MKLRPIGVVQNEFVDKVPPGWESAVQRLVIAEEWVEALEGIEEFSHLWVLFWLHGIRGPIKRRVHPEDRQYLPEVGIFATRTPWRPNPIGLQAVELLGREGNVLIIRGLDALNGSPIVDIKPYLPRGDAMPEAHVPAWLHRLWAEPPSVP